MDESVRDCGGCLWQESKATRSPRHSLSCMADGYAPINASIKNAYSNATSFK